MFDISVKQITAAVGVGLGQRVGGGAIRSTRIFVSIRGKESLDCGDWELWWGERGLTFLYKAGNTFVLNIFSFSSKLYIV